MVTPAPAQKHEESLLYALIEALDEIQDSYSEDLDSLKEENNQNINFSHCQSKK